MLQVLAADVRLQYFKVQVWAEYFHTPAVKITTKDAAIACSPYLIGSNRLCYGFRSIMFSLDLRHFFHIYPIVRVNHGRICIFAANVVRRQ